MTVELSWQECICAAHAGCVRHLLAVKARRLETVHEGDGWRAHIEGAGAEMAVAKATGMWWEPASAAPRPGADVGPYQVRWTPNAAGGLIVHDADDETLIGVLVTGKIPVFLIVGVYPVSAARHERFWRADLPRPCYIVPQAALMPFVYVGT